MKTLLISRSTLFKSPGGDTIQVLQTARELVKLGITAEIKLADDEICYDKYDILHFFNLTRPADILSHIRKSKKPFVVSPILIDYAEYDRGHRRGLAGNLFHLLSANQIEYVKAVARRIKGNDPLNYSYMWNGH